MLKLGEKGAILLAFLLLMCVPAGSNPATTGKILPERIVVDWNGDGRHDLLLGDRDGFINLYLNEGSNESPRYGTRTRLRGRGKGNQGSRPFGSLPGGLERGWEKRPAGGGWRGVS